MHRHEGEHRYDPIAIGCPACGTPGRWAQPEKTLIPEKINNVETTIITSFTELYTLLTKHWHSNFIYRGENSDKYELRSTFGRDQFTNPKNNQVQERAYFEDFKKQALPYLEFHPQNQLDWLSVAQHHCLHTRLLDWTKNPLVAIYFAVKGTTKTDTVLYILDARKLDKADDDTDPFKIDKDLIYYPKHLTRRIIAQAGLFTLHSKPVEIFNHSALEKIVIKDTCRVNIQVTLNTFNINQFSLFPSLEGLADTLTYDWIWKTKPL